MRRTICVAACLLMLPGSLVWAQQQSTQQRDQPRNQQADQQRNQQRNQQADQQSEVQRSLRIPAETRTADGDVRQLATLLALSNHAEVELGKLAAEKSQNDQVRAFAQMMVEEHTKFLDQLKQFHPQLEAAGGESAAGAVRAEAGNRERAAASDRPGSRVAAGAEAGQQGQDRLMPVLREAAQMRLEMTKQMLAQYEGQDFNMGYIGQQIVAHVDMLAHLKAMQGTGPAEFQTLVHEGIQATTGHLERAKQLASKLEDRERGGEATQGARRGTRR